MVLQNTNKEISKNRSICRYWFIIADDHMKEYPLVSSPIPVILIIVFYNYFISHLGPQLMKNRAPFQLKKLMIAYNAIQVMTNAYIIIVVSCVTMFTADTYLVRLYYNNYCKIETELFTVWL